MAYYLPLFGSQTGAHIWFVSSVLFCEPVVLANSMGIFMSYVDVKFVRKKINKRKVIQWFMDRYWNP